MTQLPWYVARSSGIVAWSLLAASMLWGLLMTTKALGTRVRRTWLLDLHRYLGGLATVFVGIHVGTLLLDTYVHFDLAAVLVPFASRWRTGAVAWGVVGLYLLVAIEATSLARQRLPRRLWRTTHMASFPLFAVATVHALTAGTDARSWLFELIAVAGVMLVSGLAAARFAGPPSPPPAATVGATRRPTVAARG